MTTVTYEFELGYPILNNRRYPALQIAVASLSDPDRRLETDAFLDSGAELSLFTGEIATSIGLDLLSGSPKGYSSTAGRQIQARMHRVRLSHADLGAFDLEIGFSLQSIHRNLLGRDFFDHVQIGFREHRLVFYMSLQP